MYDTVVDKNDTTTTVGIAQKIVWKRKKDERRRKNWNENITTCTAHEAHDQQISECEK